MLFGLNKQNLIKRYARLLLALFVMSVLNISMQMPAHAAMQMSMEQMNSDMNHSMMGEMDDMSSCHCPPVLCDSVLAIDNQSNDGLQLFESHVEKNTHSVIEMLDPNQGQLNLFQRYTITELNANQFSAPPLLIKTLLLI